MLINSFIPEVLHCAKSEEEKQATKLSQLVEVNLSNY